MTVGTVLGSFEAITPRQTCPLASVAVDLWIGQLVDAPKVGVPAILPLDIFEAK